MRIFRRRSCACHSLEPVDGKRLERMCRMIRRMEDVGDIRELTALL
jgi:hypothetical protein